MSATELLGVTWEDLLERVTGTAWRAWVEAEPDLGEVPELGAVPAAAGHRSDPDLANRLLGGLVRLGAADGGDDQNAALAVAILLAPGTARMARELRNLSPDVDELIAGALWLQIRTFPWQRRRRAIAKSLLMDTRNQVRTDLGVPRRRADRPDGPRVFPVEMTPGAWTRFEQVHHGALPDGAERGGGELAEVLAWATSEGVLATGDADLLLDLVAAGEDGVDIVWGLTTRATLRQVAAARGVNWHTVQRHRDSALARLRHVRRAYTDVA